MTNYATIPDEVQPAAKTSWRRAVAVAAAASFVLGTFALRTATPTVACSSNGPPPGRARVTVGAGCKCLGRDSKCLEASRREK